MRVIQKALTFDDVLLLPAHSRVLPREVSLKTRLSRKLELNIPLVSAAMDTVTEARLAIAMAQEGGIGIVHKNLTAQGQAAEVAKVKRFESGVLRDPMTVTPEQTVREVIALQREHKISGFPVVKSGKVVGIVTNRDLRFETQLDQPVKSIMTPQRKLITVRDGSSRAEAMKLMHQHRLERVLVVDEEFRLKGLVTVKDILKESEHPNACKDPQGKLRVGAAVGVGEGTDERVAALVEAGADVLVVDTAHGHAQGVLDRVKWIKSRYPQVEVVGGNVGTAEGAKALVDHGADGVKVGIVTNRDLRFETQLDQPVKSIMTPQKELVTVREGASRAAASATRATSRRRLPPARTRSCWARSSRAPTSRRARSSSTRGVPTRAIAAWARSARCRRAPPTATSRTRR